MAGRVGAFYPKLDMPEIISRLVERYELTTDMYEFAYDEHYRSIQSETVMNEETAGEDIVFDYELKWE